MVTFAIELHKLGLEVLADIGEYLTHSFKRGLAEYAFAVFGHKDQVYVHIEYAMPAMSNIT